MESAHFRTHFDAAADLLQLKMSLQSEFEQAAADMKCTHHLEGLKLRPSDQEQLDLYGLYKQANAGDIDLDKPGMLDLRGQETKRAMKSQESWMSRKGMSKEDAMTAYIKLAKEAIAKYGMKEVILPPEPK